VLLSPGLAGEQGARDGGHAERRVTASRKLKIDLTNLEPQK